MYENYIYKNFRSAFFRNMSLRNESSKLKNIPSTKTFIDTNYVKYIKNPLTVLTKTFQYWQRSKTFKPTKKKQLQM